MERCIEEHNFQLDDAKTDIDLLTKRGIGPSSRIQPEETEIIIEHAVKYLGLIQHKSAHILETNTHSR